MTNDLHTPEQHKGDNIEPVSIRFLFIVASVVIAVIFTIAKFGYDMADVKAKEDVVRVLFENRPDLFEEVLQKDTFTTEKHHDRQGYDMRITTEDGKTYVTSPFLYDGTSPAFYGLSEEAKKAYPSAHFGSDSQFILCRKYTRQICAEVVQRVSLWKRLTG